MIIAFAKDWNDVPTCVTHLLRGMAKNMPVLWIESIGTRRPSLGSGRDLRRIVRRLRAAAAGPQWKENQLWVWSPLLIPRARGRLSLALNRLLLRHTLRNLQPSTFNLQPAEYWCFVPNAVDLVPRGARTIYYCVDDWTRFENLDGAWMAEKEQRLLKRATTVFATSSELVAKCRMLAGERVHCMPHGVDYAKFRRALDPAMPLPPELADIPCPIVGFYGNLSAWIDFALIRALAAARPQWTFVLIGPVYVDLERIFSQASQDLALQPPTSNLQPSTFNLQRMYPNLRFLGRREHDVLPAYCKAFAAAMIPYDLEHPRMQSVNPVKARELLAAGVPIVSCDIPEMRGYGDDVLIAGRDPGSWLAALEHQIQRSDRDAISRRRAGDDWSQRIARIRAMLA